MNSRYWHNYDVGSFLLIFLKNFQHACIPDQYLFHIKTTWTSCVFCSRLLKIGKMPWRGLSKAVHGPSIDHITRKTPNPKGRLYNRVFRLEILIKSVMLVFSTPLVNKRPSTFSPVHPPFPVWIKYRSIHYILGGFIKDEYCSWVQYKSGPGGGRRCKKVTLNDLVHLTPLRIPLMNPPTVCNRGEGIGLRGEHSNTQCMWSDSGPTKVLYHPKQKPRRTPAAKYLFR